MKIKKLNEEVIQPKPNGYHSVWNITDTIGVHNDGGVYHVFDRANGNHYLLNTDSLDELNTYLDTNYGKTIADPNPKEKPVEEPKKRYPLYMYKALEDAVASMDNIPDEHKEQFISLVGDRATTKRIPRVGYKSALLPAKLRAKYGEQANYNSLITRPERYETTLEQALTDIYDVMKNKWFKALKESLKYSQESFDKAYEFLKDATDNFTKEGRFTLPKDVNSTACEDILSDHYESSGLTGDSENPTYPEEVRAFKPISNAVNESVESKFTLNEALFNEDYSDEVVTLSRYLDVEVPDICSGVLDLIEHLPSHKIVYITKICRDFYAKMESIIKNYTMTGDNFDESLQEDVTDVVTDALEGPKEGPEFGLASLINDAIKDEWEAIETYNSLAVTARSEGFDNIAEVIDEINTEENKHVGQLQELLKTVSPNAEAISTGVIEGEQQLDEVENIAENFDDTDFELSSEFDISSDDDISDLEMEEALTTIEKNKNLTNNSDNIPNNIIDIDNIEEEVAPMQEPWEDIYNSFKNIEQELNGDGEAITAIIDKMYQDNKHNPDFKKAYDKWASGC